MSYLTTFSNRGEVVLQTRGRASQDGGVCARERLTIEVADPLAAPGAAPGAPARVRKIKAESQFWVLRTEKDEPRWDVKGDDLARACVGVRSFTGHWVDADSSFDVRWTSQILFRLRDELTTPGTRRVKLRCERRKGCPSDAELLRALRPLEPHITPSGAGYCKWADKTRCYDLTLFPLQCRFWHLQVETDVDDPRRILSAVLREQPSSCLHNDTGEAPG